MSLICSRVRTSETGGVDGDAGAASAGAVGVDSGVGVEGDACFVAIRRDSSAPTGRPYKSEGRCHGGPLGDRKVV